MPFILRTWTGGSHVEFAQVFVRRCADTKRTGVLMRLCGLALCPVCWLRKLIYPPLPPRFRLNSGASGDSGDTPFFFFAYILTLLEAKSD